MKYAIQFAVVVIVGIVAIILAQAGDNSYLAIITAILGLLAPSPVQKLIGGGDCEKK